MPWNDLSPLRRHLLTWLLLSVSPCWGSLAHAGLLDAFFAGPAQTPHPAVTRIVAPEGESMSMGTGTLIHVEGDYGWVITNWHVVRGARGPIRVEFPDGFQSPAEVVKTDAMWDLALLAIWRPTASPMPVSADIPDVGDSLWIAGYGQGIFRQSRGRLQHFAAPDASQPDEFLEISTTARQGDSGGPMINERGELAGVLFGSGAGMTTGSHIGRVRAFLASVPRRPALPPSRTAAPAEFQPTPPKRATLAHARPSVPPAFFPPAKEISSARTTTVDSAGTAPSEHLPWLEAPPQIALRDDDEPLPFAELAASAHRVARPVARTSETVALPPEASPTEPPAAANAAAASQPASDGSSSPPGEVKCEGGVCRLPQAQAAPSGDANPLLSLPSSSGHPAGDAGPSDDETRTTTVQLPLPLNDTHAFLVFVFVVGCLVYFAPRSQTNDSPGDNTTG